MIAGTQSGAGKTSVTLALMAAFRAAGLTVQGFKVGPDYIDPSYHAVATGRPSHNLDVWMCGPETAQALFVQKARSAELSIIEGVMGLYDGFGSQDDLASTAQMAKLLNAPVLLVLNAQSLSRSAAAIVKGFQTFDPEVKIAGVILNKVGSARHLQLVEESVRYYTGLPVLGALFRDAKVEIPERHLGLMTASENKELSQCLANLRVLSSGNLGAHESGFSLEAIRRLAMEAGDLFPRALPSLAIKKCSNAPRIGVAQDRAFNFYYQANLDLLEELGARLVPFSPLCDAALPKGLSALYFGGGFPEVYAQELADNAPLLRQIRDQARSGLPIYAECGGLIYLSEELETFDGKRYSMAGAVPGKILMKQRLQNFGYKAGTLTRDSVLGVKGTVVRGHEFHYSDRIFDADEQCAYELLDRRSQKTVREGFAQENLLASYLHLHFLANPAWAETFVSKAAVPQF